MNVFIRAAESTHQNSALLNLRTWPQQVLLLSAEILPHWQTVATSSADAQGIGVEILDSDQTTIPVNQSETSQSWHSLTGGQANSLNFYARMVSTLAPVTAGVVTASATITLEFE